MKKQNSKQINKQLDRYNKIDKVIWWLNICPTKKFVGILPLKTVSCLCGEVALCTIKIGDFRRWPQK